MRVSGMGRKKLQPLEWQQVVRGWRYCAGIQHILAVRWGDGLAHTFHPGRAAAREAPAPSFQAQGFRAGGAPVQLPCQFVQAKSARWQRRAAAAQTGAPGYVSL